MIELNEPQIWTLIGVFSTSMFAMMTVVSTLFVRVLRAEIGSVRSEIGSVHTEIGSVRSELNSRIDGLRGEMNARFETVNHQLAGLDRDVQLLFRRVFPEPE